MYSSFCGVDAVEVEGNPLLKMHPINGEGGPELMQIRAIHQQTAAHRPRLK